MLPDDIRVEPRLVERIDAWRARQRVPPTRSAAIVGMIEEFLKAAVTAVDPRRFKPCAIWEDWKRPILDY